MTSQTKFRIGILGSGFGLYGYLPALMRLEASVVLMQRYLTILRAREDVRIYADQVEWVADEDSMLDMVKGIVIAQRPADQVKVVENSIGRANLSHFLLEKPIAPDPTSANRVLTNLIHANRTVRIGFSFRYMPWAARVREWVSDPATKRIRLRWKFRAHHFVHDRSTWKRHASQGGGPLRFYGIHLIALLAEWGYDEVADSHLTPRSDNCSLWEARFRGARLPPFDLTVDSNSTSTAFAIERTSSIGLPIQNIALSDPFSEVPAEGALDRRVDVLFQLCDSLLNENIATPSWYKQSIALWSASEEASSVLHYQE